MKFLLPMVLLFASTFAFAQKATVIGYSETLRGTPDTQGVKVTSLSYGTPVSVIGTDGIWYLLHTPDHVGWLNGKKVKMNDSKTPREIVLQHRAKVVGGDAVLWGRSASDIGKQTAILKNNSTLDVYAKVRDLYLVQTPEYAGWLRAESVADVNPKSTTEETSKTGDTIFEAEYLNAEGNPNVFFRNNEDKTLILTFGGIEYIVKPGTRRVFEIPAGRYKYTVAGGRAKPYTRVENFQKGKIYICGICGIGID